MHAYLYAVLTMVLMTGLFGVVLAILYNIVGVALLVRAYLQDQKDRKWRG